MRNDSEDPRDKKSKTDIEEPRRATLLSEREEPMAT